ncbi:MAG TPA: sulfite exporter TauE/SafE family protein [Bacteroidales bacterium]|nr:sulfite exporter TauE/SafE family protein [Bacteroidales bacterium]HPF02969.1 sulfite exporter TauE/SafE family protein [Bacteroidales bacterium]HPJ59593.1 sulfite exporter TauE/SafE family protein [Bacteroidales bacterium]HPR12946.1 sulfite exporter TauE/SafE family protein [Bacteroidales bacterium]HRW84666.1 sulfite exporter TauE/SafE family protein [Bacteroidales bacterium]
MDNSIALLSATALSLGFVHTILGPDHYLPFIVLSEAKKWTVRKTMLITFLCGLGHVLSSVVLGLIGIGVGISVNRLVDVESFRGSIAAWLFIAFGLVYMVISIRNLARKKRHSHTHLHSGGELHTHEHNHADDHVHVHSSEVMKTTPWILFLIFIFGPCEPLIPLLMYPAAGNNIYGALIVSVIFSVVTIATMMSVVLAFKMGFSKISLKPLEKYSNVIAGAMILLSGLAIQFLGL